MTKAFQGFDFSFLNDEEARKILQVLERNEELQRAEKDRIRYRVDTFLFPLGLGPSGTRVSTALSRRHLPGAPGRAASAHSATRGGEVGGCAGVSSGLGAAWRGPTDGGGRSCAARAGASFGAFLPLWVARRPRPCRATWAATGLAGLPEACGA